MLRITLKDGTVNEFSEHEYTGYEFRGKSFVVINGNRWIGIYNFDSVQDVRYIDGIV